MKKKKSQTKKQTSIQKMNWTFSLETFQAKIKINLFSFECIHFRNVSSHRSCVIWTCERVGLYLFRILIFISMNFFFTFSSLRTFRYALQQLPIANTHMYYIPNSENIAIEWQFALRFTKCILDYKFAGMHISLAIIRWIWKFQAHRFAFIIITAHILFQWQ